jgi:hypothetical protein
MAGSSGPHPPSRWQQRIQWVATIKPPRRRFESEEEFAQYAVARLLPKSLLHPRIAERVWLAFMRGEFDVAAFQAMKAVEIFVREASSRKRWAKRATGRNNNCNRHRLPPPGTRLICNTQSGMFLSPQSRCPTTCPSTECWRARPAESQPVHES